MRGDGGGSDGNDRRAGIFGGERPPAAGGRQHLAPSIADRAQETGELLSLSPKSGRSGGSGGR